MPVSVSMLVSASESVSVSMSMATPVLVSVSVAVFVSVSVALPPDMLLPRAAIVTLFHEADANGDGTLCFDEFCAIIDKLPMLRSWLQLSSTAGEQ